MAGLFLLFYILHSLSKNNISEVKKEVSVQLEEVDLVPDEVIDAVKVTSVLNDNPVTSAKIYSILKENGVFKTAARQAHAA